MSIVENKLKKCRLRMGVRRANQHRQTEINDTAHALKWEAMIFFSVYMSDYFSGNDT